MSEVSPELRAVLERAQEAGMLGPDDVAVQVAHALAFFSHVDLRPAARCVDLGSGAGVPGLPLALAHPDTFWTLIDAWEARCDLLERAVRALDLHDRVHVLHGRAEDVGHSELRAQADVVVARSFGSPAVTAECGGPLLGEHGVLVVSVAGDGSAWPRAIDPAGLVAAAEWKSAEGVFRSYKRVGPVDIRLPRRPAAQRRRPLF